MKQVPLDELISDFDPQNKVKVFRIAWNVIEETQRSAPMKCEGLHGTRALQAL